MQSAEAPLEYDPITETLSISETPSFNSLTLTGQPFVAYNFTIPESTNAALVLTYNSGDATYFTEAGGVVSFPLGTYIVQWDMSVIASGVSDASVTTIIMSQTPVSPPPNKSFQLRLGGPIQDSRAIVFTNVTSIELVGSRGQASSATGIVRFVRLY